MSNQPTPCWAASTLLTPERWEIVCSLTEAEVEDARYQEYLLGKIAHYDEHRPELEALLAHK